MLYILLIVFVAIQVHFNKTILFKIFTSYLYRKSTFVLQIYPTLYIPDVFTFLLFAIDLMADRNRYRTYTLRYFVLDIMKLYQFVNS